MFTVPPSVIRRFSCYTFCHRCVRYGIVCHTPILMSANVHYRVRCQLGPTSEWSFLKKCHEREETKYGLDQPLRPSPAMHDLASLKLNYHHGEEQWHCHFSATSLSETKDRASCRTHVAHSHVSWSSSPRYILTAMCLHRQAKCIAILSIFTFDRGQITS